MKRKLKTVSAIIAVALTFSTVFSASAAQVRSAESFTHNDVAGGAQVSVSMPDVFEAVAIVDARTLGLEESYGTITDIACDSDGNCFILTEDGIVVEFNSDFEFVKYHTFYDFDGNIADIAGAKGIEICGNEIYIADTANSRAFCAIDDIIVKEYDMPQSALIPSDFVYSPLKVAKDSKEYVYVISEGSYYGAIMYSPEGEFVGFYGANTVKGTVLSNLQYIWDSLTQNDIKRAKKIKTIPYQFVDICIDSSDFVYTCTGLTSDTNTTGQIRMLSPGGTNILYRKQYNGVHIASSSFAFGETDYATRLNKKIQQDFESIQVDKNGFIYALDLTYGLIYIYDTDCNLITAFGGGRGEATQDGLFATANSIAIADDCLYVSDSQYNSVTVFKTTEFGNALFAAQKSTLDSKYTQSKQQWQTVLQYDSQNQLALRGMAKVALTEGDYTAAMKYAEEGIDFVIYGQALKKVQSEFISNNFTWLFICAVLVVAGLSALLIAFKKRKTVLIKNIRIRVFLKGFLHPFAAYDDIRNKKTGSVRLAVVLSVLYFVSSVLSAMECNFRYTSFDKSTFNSFFQVLQSVGLIVLWALANWAISVLLGGIGKFKDVFTVTAYSTLPLIAYNFISIPLSYLLTSPNSAVLSGLSLLAMIWTGIVLSVGLMKIHDFTFPRYAVSVAIGLFFMFLIVFIIFIFGILITQLWSFIVTMFMEVVYR